MIAMGNSSAILSGVSVTASTPELSVLAAMGGFAPVPVVLDGVLRDCSREVHNAARLARFERITTPVVKVEEEISQEISEDPSEEIFAELDGEILVEYADDVAEVVALVTDADGMWARIRFATTGETLDIHSNEWETELGADAEMDLLTEWDRADVARIRADNFKIRALMAA